MQWTLLRLHVVMSWWWKALVFLTHWHTLSMLPWLRVTPSTACHSVCATCPATCNNCSVAEASPVIDTVCVGVITFQGVLIANRFCYNGNGCLFDSQRHQPSLTFVPWCNCDAWCSWLVAYSVNPLVYSNTCDSQTSESKSHLVWSAFNYYMHTYITSDGYEVLNKTPH